MSAIVPYQFGDEPIRIEEREGEPWFVLADVCRVLGIGNPAAAAARLDEDERGITSRDTPGGRQEMIVVNEAGMYRLVFRSRKAAAQRFSKWVRSDVLPTIRRTGGYGTPASAPPAPDLEDNATLRRLLMGRIDRLDQLQPKADALDRLTDARGAVTLTETAKVVKAGRDDLIRMMIRERWLYRGRMTGRLLAYQDRIHAGLLEHRLDRIPSPHGPDKVLTTVLVTAKGIAKLAEALGARD